MRVKLCAMPIWLCSTTTGTQTLNGSSTSERHSGGPWCFWGERPGFHAQHGRDDCYENGNCRNCTLRQCRSGGLGSLQLMSIEESLDRNARISTCLTFRIYNGSSVAEREQRAERVFLFSGSLIARKGVDLLARAFVRLANEVRNVRLKIVGDGELRDEIAQTLGPVSERVEFAGFKDWNELPGEYARADVLCVPSRYDGWGLVVPEGLASGLPVIATDRMGAALEFVETGRNGWLIPRGVMKRRSSMRCEKQRYFAWGLQELGRRARESVSAHTLENGATGLCSFARQSVLTGFQINV